MRFNEITRALRPDRLLVCLAAIVCAIAPLYAQDRLVEKTVKVGSKVNGLAVTGSGVLIGFAEDGVYVLTAAHVVGSDPHPTVAFHGGAPTASEVTVVAKESGTDAGLALLKVRVSGDSSPNALQHLRTVRGLDRGVGVTVIGMSRFAGDWIALEGTIQAVDQKKLVLEAEIDEGYSGGPVFLGGEPTLGLGDLIGIVVQVRGKLGIARPADDLLAFVKTHEDVLFMRNHNSMFLNDFLGTWRYFYNDSLNADRRVIRLDSDLLVVEVSYDIPLDTMIYDVRLNGDQLSFRSRTGARKGETRLKRIDRNVLQGTVTDDRGVARMRWERVK